MCEAKVYLETDSGRELVMDDVVSVKPEASSLALVDLFGDRKSVPATIKEIKLLDHEILLEPLR